MKEKNLVGIKFGSFIKFYLAASLSLGAATGMLTLVLSLLGGNATATFGSLQYTGVTAGFVSLITVPIASGVLGLVFGLLSFFPFKVLLRLLNGIKVDMTFE